MTFEGAFQNIVDIEVEGGGDFPTHFTGILSLSVQRTAVRGSTCSVVEDSVDLDLWSSDYVEETTTGGSVRTRQGDGLLPPSDYVDPIYGRTGDFELLPGYSLTRLDGFVPERVESHGYFSYRDPVEILSQQQPSSGFQNSVPQRSDEPSSWGPDSYTFNTSLRHTDFEQQVVGEQLGGTKCVTDLDGNTPLIRAPYEGIYDVIQTALLSPSADVTDLEASIDFDSGVQTRRYVPVYFAGTDPDTVTVQNDEWAVRVVYVREDLL